MSGKIFWFDLTVSDAESVRDFYAAIAGWEPHNHDMDGYNDYDMRLPGTETVTAGICHKRGANAEIPSQWMIYIQVDNFNERIAQVEHLGGNILIPPKGEKGQRLCVIQDPAGAVFTITE